MSGCYVCIRRMQVRETGAFASTCTTELESNLPF
jgi:hypothetical protein